MNRDWKTLKFIRMWPRALFHMKDGKGTLKEALKHPGVYVLYRNDEPYYIGKTGKALYRRIKNHALKPNTRRYNYWNYFSAFEIEDVAHMDEVEAILISAMPTTANNSTPKIPRAQAGRPMAKLLNNVQAMMLTGKADMSGEANPESVGDDEETF
jgi:hypothetical protein